MLQYLLYFLIALRATTARSMTGMGGGFIIKPLPDVLHGFDVRTIGILSAVAVFFLSALSIGKHFWPR